MTDYLQHTTKDKESSEVTQCSTSGTQIIQPDNVLLPQAPFSVDTGDEIGVTLFLQPPLPPPNPPGTYPPNKVRRWWVKKEDVTSKTLKDAVKEIRDLYSSKNTFSLQYYDGFHLMPIINDKGLQSCLRYFLANSACATLCRIYIEETLNKGESFEVKIAVSAGTDATVSSLKGENKDGRRTKSKMEESDRMKAFKSRVFSKHQQKAEVMDKGAIRCLYETNCKKKIVCKQYNMQNFDTHVQLCHKNKKVHGGDIRMLLTMIGQSQDKSCGSKDASQVSEPDDS